MRLLIGGRCLAIAAFSILPVPHPSLLPVGLVATEWGQLVAPIALLVLWPGWRHTANGRLAGVLAIAAAALTVAPTLGAIPVARDVSPRLEAAFGTPSASAFFGAAPQPTGFALADALFGMRLRPTFVEELIYAIHDDVRLKIRIQRSAAADCSTPAPGIIMIHGPTWDTGNDTTFNALGDYLNARGYGVVTIGHRPAPRWQHPAQSDDVGAAIAYVKTNATRLAIDPNRIVLLGRSLQGHLALHAAYRQGAVRGVVAFYPPSDLKDAYEASTPIAAYTRSALSAYLGGSPTQAPAVYDRASAVSLAGAGSPPTLLIHGERDATFSFEQSERLDLRLERAGARHLLVKLPWAIHECDRNLSGPCGQISTYALERFPRRSCGRKDSASRAVAVH